MEKAWISENAEGGEIVDFLDHTAIRNILSKDPHAQVDDSDSEIEFDVAKDGR